MLNTVIYTGKKLLPLYPVAHQLHMPIKLAASATYKAGQAVEESSTPGTYQALTADANAKLILEYDIVTDAAGLHFQGAAAYAESGIGDQHTSAYAPGGDMNFATADLMKDNAGTAITAAIVTALKGVLISGTVADGILQF